MNNSSTRTLSIEGMTCDDCVKKVRVALAAVPGITIDTVRIGSATIVSEKPAQSDAACAAVVAAGFKAHFADNSSDKNGSTRPASHSATSASSNGTCTPLSTNADKAEIKPVALEASHTPSKS